MKLVNILKDIGLSQNEAKTYLALLELGEANLKEVADKSGIPRTSLYTTIRNLKSRGMVDFYKRKERMYYLPLPPEKALGLYETKMRIFEENLPQFRERMGEVVKRPQIKLFEDEEGIKIIFNKILEEKRPILATTCIEDMRKIADDFFDHFIQQRIKQNLRIKLLTNRTPNSQELKTRDSGEIRETRFVPKDYRFDTANYIFGDKVAMLSLKQRPVLGVLIEDRAIAETHRMYFDLIWDMASLT